jgi:hypothetical protein
VRCVKFCKVVVSVYNSEVPLLLSMSGLTNCGKSCVALPVQRRFWCKLSRFIKP